MIILRNVQLLFMSRGKAKPAISDDDDDDFSSEKETVKKTNVETRKSMRDDEGYKRRLKETHIKQSERKLTPGCTIMFYLLPPHGKMTGKYVGLVKRNGKDAK